MHLADAFIQSDLHCIQVTVYILSALLYIYIYVNCVNTTNLKFGVIMIFVVLTEISDIEVMMLKIQLCITAINYILTDIHIKNGFLNWQFEIHNFYCIFDQINAAIVSDLLQKH